MDIEAKLLKGYSQSLECNLFGLWLSSLKGRGSAFLFWYANHENALVVVLANLYA